MNFTTDIVIGLEVHVELNTKSKLFCGCSRRPNKNEEPNTGTEAPNTRTCPVCLGHPGSKPVLNKTVVDYALKLALALDCDISKELIFSRKSYFYPDMSKNFQISQYEIPLATNGCVKLAEKDVRLVRIHIEEDPAALVHPSGMEKSTYVLVDYNRSGNPLVEVVTEPDMVSPKEAREFMKQLISVLNYLGIYDINTCVIKADANVSIKESGYVRAEIKNVTGFKEIERALSYEIDRQKKEVSDGKKLVQETRAWDSDVGITRLMRTKETEEDYGYIIEPDLVVTNMTDEWVERVRDTLPELARDKKERFIKDFRIDKTDAAVLSSQIELGDLYEKVAEKIDPVLAARWLRRELLRVMNYNEIDFVDLKIDESHLIELLKLLSDGKITDNVAKKILEKLVDKPFNIMEYIEKEGLKVSDTNELSKICEQVIKKNPKVIDDYKSGNVKSLNFLIGQVMRHTKGAASPDDVKKILVECIK